MMNIMNNFKLIYWVLSFLVIGTMPACNRQVIKAENNDGCMPIRELSLNKAQFTIVKSALSMRINSQREKFDIDRFCGYSKPTSNADVRLLVIYKNGSNHISKSWIIVSGKTAINTKLNQYYMVTDTAGTNKLIRESVRMISSTDQQAKNEIIQMLVIDANHYYKKGIKLGSQ